jgi:hypothetical protein
MKRIDWDSVLERAAAIVADYSTGVTLRQLFYRLVSEQLIRNNETSYKGLSRATAGARRAGEFPALIDNAREISRRRSWNSPADAIDDAISRYRRDRTEGQKYNVYIGVEKAGMAAQLMHGSGRSVCRSSRSPGTRVRRWPMRFATTSWTTDAPLSCSTQAIMTRSGTTSCETSCDVSARSMIICGLRSIPIRFVAMGYHHYRASPPTVARRRSSIDSAS